MLAFISVLLFSISASIIARQYFRTSSALFASAAAVWSLYALVMICLYGLSQTFEQNNRLIIFDHWKNHVRDISFFAIPAAILFLMEMGKIAPSSRITAALYWLWLVVNLVSLAITHVIVGFAVPVFDFVSLSPLQLSLVSSGTQLVNIGSQLCHVLFFGVVAWTMIRNLPAAFLKFVRYVRSL